MEALRREDNAIPIEMPPEIYQRVFLLHITTSSIRILLMLSNYF